MSGRSIGQNIDQPGNHAIYSVPILDIGTFQTRMKGDGRKVDDQVAEPPQAAWVIIALWIALGVRIFEVCILLRCRWCIAFADHIAKTIQTGKTLGERAERGRDIPRDSPTTWEVAAVPRN